MCCSFISGAINFSFNRVIKNSDRNIFYFKLKQRLGMAKMLLHISPLQEIWCDFTHTSSKNVNTGLAFTQYHEHIDYNWLIVQLNKFQYSLYHFWEPNVVHYPFFLHPQYFCIHHQKRASDCKGYHFFCGSCNSQGKWPMNLYTSLDKWFSKYMFIQ